MITKEQRERLEAMCDPAQNKWDLSPNDVSAIAAALATIDAQREEYDDMVRAFCRAAGVERDDHGQAVERVTKMRADIDAQRGQLDAIEDAIIGHDDEDMKHPKCTVAELVKRVLVERDAQREEIERLIEKTNRYHDERGHYRNEALASNDRIAALEAENAALREELRERPAIQKFMEGK